MRISKVQSQAAKPVESTPPKPKKEALVDKAEVAKPGSAELASPAEKNAKMTELDMKASVLKSRIEAHATKASDAPGGTGPAKWTGDEKKAAIKEASQQNEISKDRGNGKTVCGGAAATNALILSDKNGENGAALRKSVDEQIKSGKMKPLSKDEDAALKKFESGDKLDRKEIQHLQQVNYRLGATLQTGKEPADFASPEGLRARMEKKGPLSEKDRRTLQNWDDVNKGRMPSNMLTDQERKDIADLAKRGGYSPPGCLNPPPELDAGGMAALTSTLKKNGAFQDGGVTFHNTRQPDGGNHWTTTTNGTFADSGYGGADDAKVENGTPGKVGDMTDEKARGEVRVHEDPPRVVAEYKDRTTGAEDFKRMEIRPNTKNEWPSVDRGSMERKARDADMVSTSDEKRKAKEALDVIHGQSTWSPSSDDTTVNLARNHPEYLQYATPEQRERMIAHLNNGWTDDEDKAAMRAIIASASTEAERARLRELATDLD